MFSTTKLAFAPSVLYPLPLFLSPANANVGDIVQFTFKQKNHTITQSTLGTSPCSPMDGGFDSGFIPVAANATEFPLAQLTVQDTNPIWIYCRQTGHCQQGMVFAINPGDKLAAFQSAATGSTTGAATSAAASTTNAAATGVVTVTATVTVGGEPITTTYASYPGSASPTSAVSTDHSVIVGGPNGLIYTPSNITAQPGDTVTFRFHEKNHTVTQSSFADPCRALSLTSTTGQIGFDSGFMAVAANATQNPTFTIQINDAGHCGKGMVFSVNAIESGPNNLPPSKRKLSSSTALQLPHRPRPPLQNVNASNGASILHVRSAAAILALGGMVAGLVL
ncbi:hypothetical protein B0H10DRAFT_2067459 [Mycena sp. CBHHK59/15]|nr:hypothetical protein B0H10DRAFT_2067459 [Mycena sp. CBHHK59/15]